MGIDLVTSFLPQTGALAAGVTTQLARLNWIDVLVIAIYFVIVVFIGFYLRGSSNTSEEFFMAGREMTAWIAGLSFVSANLGSLELMGWAGSAYQYGILAMHWYWIGAIPAMLFLGIVMMPFYYISKTHSVPGYLHLRFGEGSSPLSADQKAADSWQAEAKTLLTSLEGWKADQEGSPADSFHERAILYSSVLELLPPGWLHDTAPQSAMAFLADSEMKSSNPLEWLLELNSLMSLKQPEITKAMLASKDPVISLYRAITHQK